MRISPPLPNVVHGDFDSSSATVAGIRIIMILTPSPRSQLADPMAA